jgi:predicted porin
MKKTLVALAALAATGAFAQSTFTIDGLVDAGVQSNKYRGATVTGFEGNGAGTTQLNFKATEDLGGGMKVNFRLETDFSIVNNVSNTGGYMSGNGGVNGTVGTSSNVAGAGTNHVSVPSRFGNGELLVGLATPYGKVDFGALNNGGLDFVAAMGSGIFGTAIGGGYGSIIGADPSFTIVRWQNSFRYTTPVFAGFSGSFIQANKQDQNAGADVASSSMGLFNVYGAQELTLKYANGPFSAIAVSTTTDGENMLTTVGGAAKGVKSTQTSFGGSYLLMPELRLTLGAQNTVVNSPVAGAATLKDRKATFVGASYIMGANQFVLEYATMKEDGTGNASVLGGTAAPGNSATMIGLGYNYMLSKMTRFYVRYENIQDDTKTLYPFAGTTASLLSNTTSTDTNRTRQALGIRMDF